MLACEDSVHGDGLCAWSNTTDLLAHRSRFGVVSRAYPYKLRLVRRTVSQMMITTLGASGAAFASRATATRSFNRRPVGYNTVNAIVSAASTGALRATRCTKRCGLACAYRAV